MVSKPRFDALPVPSCFVILLKNEEPPSLIGPNNNSLK